MCWFAGLSEVVGVKLYVTVEGMFCEHCHSTVRSALRALPFVESAELYAPRGRLPRSPSCFELEVPAGTQQRLPEAKAAIARAVEQAGYSSSQRWVTAAPPAPRSLAAAGRLLAVAACIVILAGALKLVLGYDFLSVIPTIDSTLSLGALFLTGLMTSVHCMGMCGSLTLAATLGAGQRRSAKQPLLFNLGRLASYTAVGALAGAVGGVFSLSAWAGGVLMMAAAVLMLAMALSVGGVVRVRPKLPAFFSCLPAAGGPFALGLMNALMPCGPLQAMQLYALASGSALMGALSMAAFCLGTIPLLLGFGLASNLVKGRARDVMQTIGAGLMLVLAAGMLYRGALGCGILPQQPAPAQTFDSYITASVAADGSIQEAAFELGFSGYQDVLLQSGVPARITIHADSGHLTGCNNALQVPAWGIAQELHEGSNVIELAPQEPGVYSYSCWMNMLSNTIVVVEDLENPVIPAGTEQSGGSFDE